MRDCTLSPDVSPTISLAECDPLSKMAMPNVTSVCFLSRYYRCAMPMINSIFILSLLNLYTVITSYIVVVEIFLAIVIGVVGAPQATPSAAFLGHCRQTNSRNYVILFARGQENEDVTTKMEAPPQMTRLAMMKLKQDVKRQVRYYVRGALCVGVLVLGAAPRAPSYTVPKTLPPCRRCQAPVDKYFDKIYTK